MANEGGIVPGAGILVRLGDSGWAPAKITKIRIVRTVDTEYVESFEACVASGCVSEIRFVGEHTRETKP